MERRSHDHLGDRLSATRSTSRNSSGRFVAWVAKLIGVSADDGVAIDGKTLRRLRPQESSKSGGSSHEVRPSRHAEAPRVLAKSQVADKSNEIIAIPALLGHVG